MMASDLILKSLEIQRFRGIRELKIGRLGRVNLIVGKNNVGKSTVLEAVHIYAKAGSVEELLQVLFRRGEIQTPLLADWNVPQENRFSFPVHVLFHDRTFDVGADTGISIGPIGPDHLKYKISIEEKKVAEAIEETVWYLRLGLAKSYREYRLSQASHRHASEYSASRTPQSRTNIDTTPFSTTNVFILEPGGISEELTGTLWDAIALTEFESDVIEALHLIFAEVERIALIATETKKRIAVVKLTNMARPIPLKSVGDGVNKLFGLALSLVNSKDGLLLIDEIENGVHYSVQADLWRLIFKTASRLNVQVFATTHSYDCIKAFELAARESEEEGVLIRLAKRNGEIMVAEFDEKELNIAVEAKIEVR